MGIVDQAGEYGDGQTDQLLHLGQLDVGGGAAANMVASPDEWPWSSYRYYMGDMPAPSWLECDWLLAQFGTRRPQAVAAYRDFVLAGIGKASPGAQTRHKVLLGDDDFIGEHQQLQQSEELVETVRAERAAVALSLAEYHSRFPDRTEAMARAYFSTAFTMPSIALAFDVSVQTVSRAVKTWEGRT